MDERCAKEGYAKRRPTISARELREEFAYGRHGVSVPHISRWRPTGTRHLVVLGNVVGPVQPSDMDRHEYDLEDVKVSSYQYAWSYRVTY